MTGGVLALRACMARALKDNNCEAIFASGGLKVNLLPGGAQ